MTPAVVEPGSNVALEIRTDGLEFGADFVLERESADGWEPEYRLLTILSQNFDEGLSAPWDEALPAIPFIQLVSPGSFDFELPADAPDGVYRICPRLLDESACGEFRIMASDSDN